MGSTEAENENDMRSDRAVDKGEETAGKAAEDRAEHERQEFPVGVPDAQGGGGDLAHRKGPQRPAHSILEEPGQEEQDQDAHDPDHVVLAKLSVELKPEDVQGIDSPKPVGGPDHLPFEHDGEEYLTQTHRSQSEIEVPES